MANKLLNLDELATEEKVIKLDGISHKMREMTVQEFIDTSKEAAEISAKPIGEMTMAEKTEAVVKMIADAYPTLTTERLGKLSFVHLNAILEFTVEPPKDIEKRVAAGND